MDKTEKSKKTLNTFFSQICLGRVLIISHVYRRDHVTLTPSLECYRAKLFQVRILSDGHVALISDATKRCRLPTQTRYLRIFKEVHFRLHATMLTFDSTLSSTHAPIKVEPPWRQDKNRRANNRRDDGVRWQMRRLQFTPARTPCPAPSPWHSQWPSITVCQASPDLCQEPWPPPSLSLSDCPYVPPPFRWRARNVIICQWTRDPFQTVILSHLLEIRQWYITQTVPCESGYWHIIAINYYLGN